MVRSCTLNNRNLRDEYIKRMHKNVEEMIRYTDIASCDKVVMTKEQLKRFENDINQLKLPARVIYMTSGTLRKVISGFYNKETGNSVCMHHKVVEELIRVDPTIFDGVNINIGEPQEEENATK